MVERSPHSSTRLTHRLSLLTGELKMSKDMGVIKQLEQRVGTVLAMRSMDEIRSSKGYSMDKYGNVFGLNLRGSSITDISVIYMLRQLKILNLSDTRISNITALKGLTKLTDLYLHENQISDISPLQNLTNLTRLNLGCNKISDISPLSNILNLTELSLYRNNITEIIGLKNLTNLCELDLRHNKIAEIPVSHLKDLWNLTYLDLSNNELSELPLGLIGLTMDMKWEDDFSGKGAFLYGNPLNAPPIEILNQGREAIKTWYKSLAGEKGKALNEMKVILVGDGSAGKTSLVKRLLEQDFNKNEPQTHGINIKRWIVRPEGAKDKIKINIWDFGGQAIMHATHQFFLSKRSLYVLVLDGRKDEDAEYWLKHIESFGGDSPVLVVINKIDDNPGFEVNRKFLMGKHPNIKAFFRTSCYTWEGIKEFSQALIREVATVKHIHTTWAESWFSVKEKLENMKADMEKDFISFDDYVKICNEKNIRDEEAQRILAEFLNDLGVILHFDDPALKETNVINPEWATKAVYEIINSQTLSDNKGILSIYSLNQILDKYDYPQQKHYFIIELMKKFELCYSIDPETILVPDLLAVEEPEFEFDYDSTFKFIIQYDFLPKSIIARFIVRMHRDIKDNIRWRTGVVLEDRLFDCTTVVKVDEREKQLSVHVSGVQKREYFAILRKMIMDINNSFERMKTIEMVPCSCSECADTTALPTPPTPHYYDYVHLLKAQKKGKTTVECRESFEDVAIEQLLSGIEIEKEETPYRWDVFISYSSKDKRIIEDIVGDLKRHRISYWWDDEQIEPGDAIGQTIEKGLEGSRFVLAYFSHNQLKSGWCRVECESILNEVISGGTNQKVLPLILDDLEDERMPLLIRGYKYERYSDPSGYQKILKLLKKPFVRGIKSELK
jgi:small GTP-binding protein